MFKFEDICKLYGTYSASFVDNGIDRLKKLNKNWGVNSILETYTKHLLHNWTMKIWYNLKTFFSNNQADAWQYMRLPFFNQNAMTKDTIKTQLYSVRK